MPQVVVTISGPKAEVQRALAEIKSNIEYENIPVKLSERWVEPVKENPFDRQRRHAAERGERD